MAFFSSYDPFRDTSKDPKRAFIYTGGDICPERITECPKAGELRIAADSGYHNASRLGQRVDILIGDRDSIGAVNLPGDIEIIELEPEKDLTDTQAAVELAVSRGVEDLTIIGGIGTRLDHTVSNMYILEDMWRRGIYCKLVNGYNRVSYINSTSTIVGRGRYKYLSVIAADEKVKGVTVDGCRYPLKDYTLERRIQFAVSNEIDGNCAMISVRRGGIFIIESND